MIISASRRTDIPSFFSEWFYNQIVKGYFMKMNPYNRKEELVEVTPSTVEAIVFWTKNPKPLLGYLNKLDGLGYRYLFHFTLNNYEELGLEPGLAGVADRIKVFQDLSKQIGKEKVIWRYDPIVVSNQTTEKFHIANFSYLAVSLKGYTQRVIISFLDFYPKKQARLKQLTTQKKLEIIELRHSPEEERLFFLVQQLQEIALQNGLEIYTCGEVGDFSQFKIEPGSCIDGKLINHIFNLTNDYPRDKSQRAACRCVKSVDIGRYRTCQYQCSYCYAN